MKNFIQLCVCAGLFLTSCTKNAATPASVNIPVTPGNYTITLFTDNSNGDMTATFAAYTFSFQASNTISAVTEIASVNGTWSQTASHENEAAKMEISFANAPLSLLNKKWEIVSVSATEIDLRDDNTASNEHLHFTKQ